MVDMFCHEAYPDRTDRRGDTTARLGRGTAVRDEGGTCVGERQPTCSGPVPGEAVTTLGDLALAGLGYVTEEWFLDGTATSWRPVGSLGDDGRWQVEEGEPAPFRSRAVVCRPDAPHRFNGTVVVEWLNVSGGGDGSPEWFYLHRHLLREGAAWVGVSAQKAGIDGGGLLRSGQHLKAVAPERYGDLVHPGDAWSYDIFSQAGRALLGRRGGPMGDLGVERLLAVGESQSAVCLVTYVNAVDPVARVYDAFLVHGRGARGMPLDGVWSDPMVPDGHRHPIRDDVRVPVLTVQSETDVVMFGGSAARQPDTDRVRLWEIAGAAHFDTYGLFASRHDDGSLSADGLASLLVPTAEVLGMPVSAPVNSGPQQHYVLQAAIAHLDAWVRHGAAPPTAPPLETTGDPAHPIGVDELGIARCGVRTPWVDAPVNVLSGLGQEGERLLTLFGTTRAMSPQELAARYPDGRGQYLEEFAAALDSAVREGFVLADDRDEAFDLAVAGCPLP